MAHDILTETYNGLRRRLRAMATAMLGNSDDADDALQDAFCKLWSRHESITDAGHAAGLLTVTVRHTGIDYLRRRVATTDVDNAACDEAAEADDANELLAEVTALIESRLSARSREILYRRDRDGEEYASIAEAYGLSEANVRIIISRARQQVRELYSQKRNTTGYEK